MTSSSARPSSGPGHSTSATAPSPRSATAAPSPSTPSWTRWQERRRAPASGRVTRYEDLRAVSRQPHIFSSASGITLSDDIPEARDFFGSMIVLDDPRHAKLRLLVQRAFTPKTVAAIEESVRVRARELVAAAADKGECDFVESFAAPLPLQIICDMLGVPAADERDVFDWTNVILGAGDPDFGGSFDALFAAAMAMYGYAQAARAGPSRPPA